MSLAKQAPRWGLNVRKESRAEPQVKVWESSKPSITSQPTWWGGWGALSGHFLRAGHALHVLPVFPIKALKMFAFAEHLNDDKRRGKCLVVPSKLG